MFAEAVIIGAVIMVAILVAAGITCLVLIFRESKIHKNKSKTEWDEYYLNKYK